MVTSVELGSPQESLSVLVVCVFLLAGLVKGVVGLGLPTISMAMLGQVMTPAEAAALLIIPSLATNIWQIRPWSGAFATFKRLGTMHVGVCFGTFGGFWLMGAPAGPWAEASLGGSLVIYASLGLSGNKMNVEQGSEWWLGPVAGTLTGLVTSATGVFVIPAVPYLQALGLKRDELIQAMGSSFTVSTLSLAVGLYATNRYTEVALESSSLLLVPALLGMCLGQGLRMKVSPAIFRRCFLVSLLLLGMLMFVRVALSM